VKHALLRVRNTALDRARSEDDYRAALSAAIAAGHSYAELARAAGVSRQAIQQRVARDRRP